MENTNASLSTNLFKSKTHNKNSRAPPRIAAADFLNAKSDDGGSRKTLTIAPHHDGYEWRKYGQKQTTGIPFPRCYYRCTYRDEQGCHAKKRVQQQSSDDPPLFAVIYKNEHTCNSNTVTTSYYRAVDDSTSTRRDQPFFLSFVSKGDEVAQVENQKHVQYSTSNSCTGTPIASTIGHINRPSGEFISLSPGLPSSCSMENMIDHATTEETPDDHSNIFWGECLSPNSFGYDQTGYVLEEDSFYSEPDGSETSQPLPLW